ncbi:MAG: hypothetical protein GC160_26515 [Acidobacteria bacterium]|nr:hypothetical protein [Acidobacteriota bacterium]
MDVVEALIDSERRLGWDRLILAGPLEGRKEVERLLPKRLQSKVVGSVALWVEAKRDDILEVAEEIEAAIERKGEQQMVENLVQDAAKNHAAVLGLEPTLATLREGRIDKLLVAGDFRPKWSDLPDMALWLDEGQTRQEGSLLERILERTLADGGRVEFVWGEASDLLRERGDGIGAFLRY